MRLNGWQRIGVILSAIWILSILVILWMDAVKNRVAMVDLIRTEQEPYCAIPYSLQKRDWPRPLNNITRDGRLMAPQEQAQAARDQADFDNREKADYEKCLAGLGERLAQDKKDRALKISNATASKYFDWYGVLWAVVILACAWGSAYGLVYIGRWVRAGFQK